MLLLVICVGDIIITGDDVQGISDLKFFQKYFQTKNLGSLQYFVGIKIARSSKRITLSQKKYVFDILSDVDMLGCRIANASIKANIKLLPNQGEILDDLDRYS